MPVSTVTKFTGSDAGVYVPCPSPAFGDKFHVWPAGMLVFVQKLSLNTVPPVGDAQLRSVKPISIVNAGPSFGAHEGLAAASPATGIPPEFPPCPPPPLPLPPLPMPPEPPLPPPSVVPPHAAMTIKMPIKWMCFMVLSLPSVPLVSVGLGFIVYMYLRARSMKLKGDICGRLVIGCWADMEWAADFFSWAWARHHNVWSWYVRPMFILPYVYFAYKRSWLGIGMTIAALFTSMFWFPAPVSVDPAVERFLQAERDYVFGRWTFVKVLLTLTVPAFFCGLGLAFWRRSWWWGVAVINAAALGKMAWSVVEGGESGWAVVVPAAIGMLVCNAGVYAGVKFIHRKKTTEIR